MTPIPTSGTGTATPTQTVPAVPDQCPTRNPLRHSRIHGLTCMNSQTVPVVPEIPEITPYARVTRAATEQRTPDTGTTGTAAPIGGAA